MDNPLFEVIMLRQQRAEDCASVPPLEFRTSAKRRCSENSAYGARPFHIGALVFSCLVGQLALAGSNESRVVKGMTVQGSEVRLAQRLVNGSEFGIPVVFSASAREDVVSIQASELKYVESVLPVSLQVDLVTDSDNPANMRVIGRSGHEVLSIRLARHLAQIHCLGLVERLSRHQTRILERTFVGATVLLAYRPVHPGSGGDCVPSAEAPESSRVLFVRSEGSVFKVHLDDGLEPVIQRLGRLKI